MAEDGVELTGLPHSLLHIVFRNHNMKAMHFNQIMIRSSMDVWIMI